MKKIILGLVILISIISIGFSQDSRTPKIDMTAKVKIEETLALAEHSSNNQGKLNTTLPILDYYIDKFWETYIYPSPEAMRDITIRLIKVFYQIGDSGTGSANKLKIIEIIGRHDNSVEAHVFFLQLLDLKDGKYREMALWSMGRNGVRGDDVYDRIKTLLDTDVLKRDKFLYALKSANPRRAVKEIQAFLAITKNVNSFTSYGLALCDYKDPELLDILIDRYDEFKNMVPSSPEERAVYAPARAAFHPDVLKRYLEIREGKRFKKGLEVLGAKEISGDENLPLFAKKLRSKNLETRGAVLEFMDFQIDDNALSREKLKQILTESKSAESDPKLKAKIQQMITKLGAK